MCDVTYFRHMQMQVCLVEEVVVGLFLRQEVLGERVRDLRRLLHDVTEVARQRHAALTVGLELVERSSQGRFNVESRASYAAERSSSDGIKMF